MFKDLNKFGVQSSRKDGHRGACIDCFKKNRTEKEAQKMASTKTKVQTAIYYLRKNIWELADDHATLKDQHAKLGIQIALRDIELMATEDNSMTVFKTEGAEWTEQDVLDKLVADGIKGLTVANIKLVSYDESYLVVVTSGMSKRMRNILI
jgi:hypothetical protein